MRIKLEQDAGYNCHTKWLIGACLLFVSPALLPFLFLVSVVILMLFIPLGCALIGLLSWQKLRPAAARVEKQGNLLHTLLIDSGLLKSIISLVCISQLAKLVDWGEDKKASGGNEGSSKKGSEAAVENDYNRNEDVLFWYNPLANTFAETYEDAGGDFSESSASTEGGEGEDEDEELTDAESHCWATDLISREAEEGKMEAYDSHAEAVPVFPMAYTRRSERGIAAIVDTESLNVSSKHKVERQSISAKEALDSVGSCNKASIKEGAVYSAIDGREMQEWEYGDSHHYYRRKDTKVRQHWRHSAKAVDGIAGGSESTSSSITELQEVWKKVVQQGGLHKSHMENLLLKAHNVDDRDDDNMHDTMELLEFWRNMEQAPLATCTSLSSPSSIATSTTTTGLASSWCSSPSSSRC